MPSTELAVDDTDQDRRDSFRFNDNVTLRVRILDDESIESIENDFNTFRMRYGLKSHIQNQRDLRKPQLIRIRKSSPDVAEYLESLEFQITQLAERIDENRTVASDSVEISCHANLSATGIRFETSEHFEVGQTLEIGIDLNTQNTQVVMLGKILRVERGSDSENAISLDYTFIHSEDTEAIIRHLAKLQQLDLQAKRVED